MVIKNFWHRFNYLFHLALSIFDCDTHKAKFTDNIGGISFFHPKSVWRSGFQNVHQITFSKILTLVYLINNRAVPNIKSKNHSGTWKYTCTIIRYTKVRTCAKTTIVILHCISLYFATVAPRLFSTYPSCWKPKGTNWCRTN